MLQSFVYCAQHLPMQLGPRHLDVSTRTAQLLVWLLGMMGSALEGSCGEAQEA